MWNRKVVQDVCCKRCGRGAETLNMPCGGVTKQLSYKAVLKFQGSNPSKFSSSWVPLSVGSLKLNTDVAVRPGKNMIGVRAVIRDDLRFVRAAIAKTLPCIFLAEVGEFLALREGLLLAKNSGLKVFLAEVYASNVASGVMDSISNCREAALVIKDIKALFQVVGVLKYQVISHLGNAAILPVVFQEAVLAALYIFAIWYVLVTPRGAC
ncbi:hypothetical protein JRO89_XS01G0013300 [Xanthoceras sorbifolium]|uniref:RNase H type-1 domain-containing protein n=1 Tax=Xanthoceras sorbifolium TaxID=99658 RepID=A0ABQ8IHU2_9ROSI|nr:hypothetical protein JRO89_XS01G0013300 [Xanthoceras sorbifolium]